MIRKTKLAELEELVKKQEEGNMKKILIFDLETSPMEFWGWRCGQQYVGINQVRKDWTIFTWSAKWVGSTEILKDAAWYHSPLPREDKEVCRSLYKLVDEADIVVAHNGKGFDVKKMNSRFLIHGFEPPKPYKVVDTLQVARAKFGFSSNKLDELGKKFGVGRKVEHHGGELWQECLDNCAESQDLMVEYNVGDVLLLEQIYLAMRPWDNRHPNVNLDLEVSRCSVCTCKHLRQRGEVYTPVNAYCAYQCTKCGHWMRGTVSTRDKDERAKVARNIV